jgi:hypothetical protein
MTAVKALQIYDSRIYCGEGDCLTALETVGDTVAPLRPYPKAPPARVVRVGLERDRSGRRGFHRLFSIRLDGSVVLKSEPDLRRLRVAIM